MSIVKINNDERFLKFVDDKINVLRKENEEDIKNMYYLKKEFTFEEFEKMIEELDDKVRHTPKFISDNEFTTISQIKKEYIKNVQEEIRLIRLDLTKTLGSMRQEKHQFVVIPKVNNSIEFNC